MSSVIAVVCSDLHLSHKPPTFRSTECDWYGVMARSLSEIGDLARIHDVPVLIAGDVFDRWYSPPELINFAISHFPPRCYAIPGQHDLPNHSLQEIHRSSYSTLVEAGKIVDLSNGFLFRINESLWVQGFPWGSDLCGVSDMSHIEEGTVVALVHRYVWSNAFGGHPGATDDGRADIVLDKLVGFDAVVCGDNHIGFEFGRLFNCGAAFRRARDQIQYTPRIGLLLEDHTVRSYYLDTSKDRFAIEEQLTPVRGEQEFDVSLFVQELRSLGADSLDFREAVRARINQLDDSADGVRRMVLEAIDATATGIPSR